jgi:hypothetical protein
MRIRSHSESHLVKLDDATRWQVFPGDLDDTLHKARDRASIGSHRRRDQRSGTDQRGRRRSGARSPVRRKVACGGRSDSTGRDQTWSAPDRSIVRRWQRAKAQHRWKCSPQRIGKTLRHQWGRRRRKREGLGTAPRHPRRQRRTLTACCALDAAQSDGIA